MGTQGTIVLGARSSKDKAASSSPTILFGTDIMGYQGTLLNHAWSLLGAVERSGRTLQGTLPKHLAPLPQWQGASVPLLAMSCPQNSHGTEAPSQICTPVWPRSAPIHESASRAGGAFLLCWSKKVAVMSAGPFQPAFGNPQQCSVVLYLHQACLVSHTDSVATPFLLGFVRLLFLAAGKNRFYMKFI